MTAKYWVTKYVEDPFRNEPRNVGVIVEMDGLHTAKFYGERDDGTLDGRRLRGFLYPSVFTQWRDFWRRSLREGNLQAILNATTSNFFVQGGGEVTEVGGDTSADVCHFLFGLLVEGGPKAAFGWAEEDDEVSLATEIATTLKASELLAVDGPLLLRHPILREQAIRGNHATHRPSFSQRNGVLHVMEHIDLSVKQISRAKDRAGWMAYMFADIRVSEPAAMAFSLIWPEKDNSGEQIDYAKTVLTGESTVVNWADPQARRAFLDERKAIAA